MISVVISAIKTLYGYSGAIFIATVGTDKVNNIMLNAVFGGSNF